MVQCWCWLQGRSFQHVTLWWCPTVTHLGFVFTPSARLDPCNSQLFGLTLSPRKVKLRHKWITSAAPQPKQEEVCFSSYHRGFKTVPNRPTLPLTEHWDLGFYKESPKNTSLFRSIQFCWCGLAAGRLHFYCQNMLQRLPDCSAPLAWSRINLSGHKVINTLLVESIFILRVLCWRLFLWTVENRPWQRWHGRVKLNFNVSNIKPLLVISLQIQFQNSFIQQKPAKCEADEFKCMQYKYNLCWRWSLSVLFIREKLIEHARCVPAAPSHAHNYTHSWELPSTATAPYWWAPSSCIGAVWG